MNLRAIEIVHAEQPWLGTIDNSVTIHSLNLLLGEAQPHLRRLCISVRDTGNIPLELETVERHANTLEYLLTDVRHQSDGCPKRTSYKLGKLESVFSKCKRLRELGVACPKLIIMDERKSADFWKFFVSTQGVITMKPLSRADFLSQDLVFKLGSEVINVLKFPLLRKASPLAIIEALTLPPK